MFQLLNKCLVLLFFYMCRVSQVDCDDVIHMNGTAGNNLTVIFTLKATMDNFVYLYRNNTKIHTFTHESRCSSFKNHTEPPSCIHYMPGGKIRLDFINLMYSGVYHLSTLMPNYTVEKSSKVNLTVYPADYIATYTIVTALSFNNTSVRSTDYQQNPSILMFVPVMVIVIILVIVLLSLFYWTYQRKTEKTPAVNATSAPQVIPDVPCVEYCVLEFPNRAGEKVRSTEEQVEYSPIVFPPRKTMAQNDQIKQTAQQNKTTMTTLQSPRDTDKVPEKPKHHKCPKKKITPNHTLSASPV